MTVKELIEQLQGFDPDKEVVLSVTDHTDWTYNFDHPGFIIDNVYDEDEEFDEEAEYCVCSISI